MPMTELLFRSVTRTGDMVAVWLDALHPDLISAFDEIFIGSRRCESNELGAQGFRFTAVDENYYRFTATNGFTPYVFSFTIDGEETNFELLPSIERSASRVQHHLESEKPVVVAVGGRAVQSFTITVCYCNVHCDCGESNIPENTGLLTWPTDSRELLCGLVKLTTLLTSLTYTVQG